MPVYGLWDTLLEHGVVGGRLATVEEKMVNAGQDTGRLFAWMFLLLSLVIALMLARILGIL